MPPQKKTTSTSREKRKTPTKAKSTPTTTTTTASMRRKSRRGSPGSSTSKSKLSSPSPVTTTTPSSSRAPTPTPLLLPPSLTGRALPTLILDTGGWTIKHGTVTPTTNPNTITANNTIDTSNANGSVMIQPKKSYNVIAKPKHVLTTLVSNEINTIQNKSNLIFKRPLERGYTTDLGVQLQIWEYILNIESLEYRHSFSNPTTIATAGTGTTTASNVTVVDGIHSKGHKKTSKNSISPTIPGGGSCIYTHTASVFCLHQPFTPRNILEKEDEIWFRDFGFGRIHRMLGACCSAFRYLKLANNMKKIWMEVHDDDNPNLNEKIEKYSVDDDTIRKRQAKFQEEFGFVVKDDETECCCVIDSGFSLTHIVPTVKARAVSNAIRRINVGGKLLTNILKELISYRQWNMMDEYYNVNDAKELLCYASTRFEQEMKYARDDETRPGCRIFDREFVLPDYVNSFQGRVRIPLRLQMLIDEEEKKKKEEMVEASLLQREKNMLEGDGADGNNKRGNDNNDDDENNVEKSNPNSKKDANEDENDDNDSEDESEEQIRHRIIKQREEEQRRRDMEEEERQALLLSVERFTIPEILFRPSDIEMKQLGLAEAIVQSIEACDKIYHAAMYHNIVLTGGNMNIPDLKERLEIELRSIAPIQYKIRIHLPKDPTTFAFEGAQDIIQNEGFVCGMDRAEWEVNKQSGKAGNIWNSEKSDSLPDKFILI